jgi:hypothetical protein
VINRTEEKDLVVEIGGNVIIEHVKIESPCGGIVEKLGVLQELGAFLEKIAWLVFKECLPAFGRFLRVHRQTRHNREKQIKENKRESTFDRSGVGRQKAPTEEGEDCSDVETWNEDPQAFIETERGRRSLIHSDTFFK